jgi:hypothetical protein
MWFTPVKIILNKKWNVKALCPSIHLTTRQHGRSWGIYICIYIYMYYMLFCRFHPITLRSISINAAINCRVGGGDERGVEGWVVLWSMLRLHDWRVLFCMFILLYFFLFQKSTSQTSNGRLHAKGQNQNQIKMFAVLLIRFLPVLYPQFGCICNVMNLPVNHNMERGMNG